MSKFKVGDKVRRKLHYANTTEWKAGVDVHTVISCGEHTVCLEEDITRRAWDPNYFELVSEKENDVSNEVEEQVLGVPDGYRLVRIGAPKKGELFIFAYDKVIRAEENMYDYTWAIVELIEPIEPPKPKTEEIVLNKYLLNQNGQWLMVVATAGYVDTYCIDYTLLGHSETVTIEVE